MYPASHKISQRLHILTTYCLLFFASLTLHHRVPSFLLPIFTVDSIRLRYTRPVPHNITKRLLPLKTLTNCLPLPL